MKRRRFLKIGLLTGGALSASLAATGVVWFKPGPPAAGFKVLSEDDATLARAYVEAHFPPGNVLGIRSEQLQSVERELDGHVSALASADRRKVRMALRLLDNWPRVSFQSTKRLSELPLQERIAAIRALEESETHALRGLSEVGRVLIGLHAFNDPILASAIGHQLGCGL